MKVIYHFQRLITDRLWLLKLMVGFSCLTASHKGLLAIPLQQDTVKAVTAVKQPVYTTSKLSTSKPVIDGKLDDDCWKTGVWAGDYTQYIPAEGAKPSFPTEMNILYDDRYIYVAFRAFDGEPEKIQRYAGSRDEFAGDMVGINFDSYRDYRTGFEFTITAWG